ATYQRQRDGYDSNDPARKWGPGSGLYKTTDGGETWRKLTKGLPTGQLGRIGIDYYRKNPNTIYIVLESEQIGKEPENAAYIGTSGEDADAGARLTEITADGPAAQAGLKKGDIVLAVDDQTIHSYADLLNQIRQHVAGDTVKVEVSRERKSVLADVVLVSRPKRTGNGRNRSPFSAGLGGQRENYQKQQGPEGHEYGGVYRSTDNGETWTRINSINPRPMYFSQIRVDPSDESYLWVLGIAMYRSKDGGETFTDDGARDVHVDHHAMWIDPQDGRHIILGNDGGVAVTYDRGEHWDHLNHMAIGQFYHATVDPRRDYRVYGGLQDNGSWGGPSHTRDGSGPVNQDWFMLGWGDGFICNVDQEDPDQVYFASQNGGMGSYNVRTAERGFIRPQRERDTRYRFNWKTPYILSHHNSRIYYLGANVVFRSLNRGQKLRQISPEITRTDQGTATALAESPLDPDVLYVGTDDGFLWRTRNAGHDWENLTEFTAPPSSPVDKVSRWGQGALRKLTDMVGGGKPPTTRPTTRPSAQTQPTTAPPERSERRARGGRMLERLMQLDANGDGLIQRSEAPERMDRLFERFDANGDDVLDAEELKQISQRPPGPPPGTSRRRAPGEPPPTNGNAHQGTNGHTNGDPAPDTQPASQPALATTKPSAAYGPDEDPISGEWESRPLSAEMPPGRGEFTLLLKLAPDGAITGIVRSMMGDSEIADGRFDRDSGRLTCSVYTDQVTLDLTAILQAGKLTGNVEVGEGIFEFEFEATRTRTGDVLAETQTADADDAAEEDDQYNWQPLSALLPGPRWVSWIETSRYRAGRVYVTFDAHRSNDDEPYIFVSENHGQTWRSLRANLPANVGSTRVIREDIENSELLYLGTEFGAWISIDRGKSWTRFNSNLPTVAVHEFAIHPSAGEIVAATHGRSLWILDITTLRQISEKTLRATAWLYEPNSVIHWRREPSRGNAGTRGFVGENPPGDAQIYYSLSEEARSVTLKITDQAGVTIRELETSNEPGLHHATWDLRRKPEENQRRRGPRQGRLVPPGKYLVELTADQRTLRQPLKVEVDPTYPDYQAWQVEQNTLHSDSREHEPPDDDEALVDF
ncbi:MAG: PDZ domain-containing protein, partial [Planctomycetota bacterium]